MKKKEKKDRILMAPGRSALVTDIYPEWEEDEQMVETELQLSKGVGNDEALVISGELGLGGNPVTIVVIDEVTGMEMEINHVKNALFVIEDKRKNSSGWLSLVVGDIEKVGEVLRFVAKATVKELKRMVKKTE